MLRGITGGKGYDDVICMAPVKSVVEQGDAILGFDGCLNFFAGPTDQKFKAEFNFFNVHYAYTHIVGTSGGNTDDLREAIAMMNAGKLNPSVMVTHVGGLDACAETTMNLPKIPGGKKLIYTHISLPLTAIADFAELGKTTPCLPLSMKYANGITVSGAPRLRNTFSQTQKKYNNEKTAASAAVFHCLKSNREAAGIISRVKKTVSRGGTESPTVRI